MKKVLSIVMILVLVFALCACGQQEEGGNADAERPIPCKIATLDVETGSLSSFARTFEEAVDKRIPGRIAWDNYPNGALGNERELGEQVNTNQIQGAVVACSVMSAVIPLKSSQLMDAMFLFNGVEDMYRVLDEGYRAELDKEYEAAGMINMGYLFVGSQDLGFTKKEVKVPADMKGLKIRTYESQPIYAFLEGVGALGCNIAWGELFTSLQQGAIDGVYTSVDSFGESGRLGEAAKFETRIDSTTTGYGFSFDKEWFDALPADVQAAFKEAAKDAETWLKTQRYKDVFEADMKFFEANNVKLYTPTAEERALWVEAAEQYCWPLIKKNVGDELWNKALKWAGR